MLVSCENRNAVWFEYSNARSVRKHERLASAPGRPSSHSAPAPASVSSAADGPVRTTSGRSAPNTVLVPDPDQRLASSTSGPMVVVQQSTEPFAFEHSARDEHRVLGGLQDQVAAALVRTLGGSGHTDAP